MLRDEMHALDEAERIGYPVLIKPSAGGGGKGMRMVRTGARARVGRCKVCRSEAKAAFGDDSLYLEKWLDENRHVEVQVAVDRYGHGVHLGERDCSVQRRHQKILEEAPDAGPVRRGRAHDLAERAVRAVVAAGYENVGTLEFLVDAAGDFYFIEINCRIQVEHPVTEMLTGIDLVTTQIRIAAGEPLGFTPGRRRPARPRHRVPDQRRGPRRTSSGRAPASSSATTPPAARASGWTRTCTAATRSRRSTTRCSASSIVWGPDRATAIARAASRSTSSSSTAS